ncbi:P-loop containing nucleoside triphosphate hydrolase protein, partial [Podospora didyma]
MVSFDSDALSKLCSADQLELLNSIDRLRLQGINNYVSLPQIIVCGDQSSGKSSVLEAISGVAFPVKSNLCTRFPTELVLRRTPHISAKISIVPHESRSELERVALSGFKQELRGFDSLPEVMEAAKSAMGISTHGKAFSKDILRVEITGPNHPHLTIVDLPGLIHSETKHQTTSDIELIQDVVQGYMKEPRCIILAVVSAKNDISNQIVLKLARAADPTGNRTLGVITKPDTLTEGSGSEALYVCLAKNQEVEFRLGWHVLRNMDSEKGSYTLAERHAIEAEFFAKGVWTQLPYGSLGIDKLRGRLSKVLLGQIASELPSLIEEIDAKFDVCKGKLTKLGQPRTNPDEQRLYLVQLSTYFQILVKKAVDGSYNDPFFADAKTKQGYRQRVRAVLQNLNEDFASDISNRGHYREITAAEINTANKESERSVKLTRAEFIAHIEHLMRKTRGRELPGTFNPMIVADLFLEQSRPWESIVRNYIEKVWGAARQFLDIVLEHLADDSTSKGLQQHIFEPAMKNIMLNMAAKTNELLAQHQKGHPITYNDHYFNKTVMNFRRERRQKDPLRILREFFGIDESSETTISRLNGSYNLSRLAERLTESSEAEMKHFAANEALDCLNAYYKVALKRFIDDVAVEIIESKLVAALDNILSPMSVFKMTPELVSAIAGESEENRSQRDQLTRQLDVLRNGLQTCKKFVGLRIRG